MSDFGQLFIKIFEKTLSNLQKFKLDFRILAQRLVFSDVTFCLRYGFTPHYSIKDILDPIWHLASQLNKRKQLSKIKTRLWSFKIFCTKRISSQWNQAQHDHHATWRPSILRCMDPSSEQSKWDWFTKKLSLPMAFQTLNPCVWTGFRWCKLTTASPLCGTSRYSTITGKNPSRAASSRALADKMPYSVIMSTTKLLDTGGINDCSNENIAAQFQTEQWLQYSHDR